MHSSYQLKWQILIVGIIGQRQRVVISLFHRIAIILIARIAGIAASNQRIGNCRRAISIHEGGDLGDILGSDRDALAVFFALVALHKPRVLFEVVDQKAIERLDELALVAGVPLKLIGKTVAHIICGIVVLGSVILLRNGTLPNRRSNITKSFVLE